MATSPRNTNSPPTAANIGVTNSNGTRISTNINPPPTNNEIPPTRSTQYVRNPRARKNVNAPQTINNTPTISHELACRSGILWLTSASHKINPPSIATITSISSRNGSCICVVADL